MSLLPEVGHLYHDSAISNNSVILDAKEYLRTREINSREQRHLEKLSRYLDRAKTASERVKQHEKWSIKQQLRSLQIKTPTLEKALRKETERIRSINYQLNLSRTGSPYREGFVSSIGTSGFGGRAQSSWSRFSQLPSAGQFTRSYRSPTRNECGEFSSPSISLYVPSFRVFPQTRASPVRRSGNKRFYFKKTISENQSRIRTGKNFVKRAEEVVKSLHKLYRRLLEREDVNRSKTMKDVLDVDSQDLLDRARMVLGDRATDEITAMIFRPTSADQDMGQGKGRYTYDDFFTVTQENESVTQRTPTLHYETEGDDGTRNCSRQPTDKGEAFAISETVQKPDEMPHSEFKYLCTQKPFEKVNKEIFLRDKDTLSPIDTPRRPHETSRSTGGWTELSTVQALWQQRNNNIPKKKYQKETSLVTLTGKHRKTMLHRH